MSDSKAPALIREPSTLDRRRFLALGAGAGASMLLAACGGGKSASDVGKGAAPTEAFTGEYTGPNVMLQYWNGFTGGDGPFMRKLVEQFNTEHPNIKVTMNTSQWADFYAKLPAAVQGGKGPDIVAMHMDAIPANAARQIIVPLDDVAAGLKLEEKDFIPLVWKAGVYKDQRYGIPLDVHSLGMFYNKAELKKAELEEPGSDAASFEDTLKKLAAAGSKEPFWMPNRWPAHLIFLSLLWQFGGEPYAENGEEATFNSEAGVKALTWMVDQIKNGHGPKNVAQDSQYTAFKNGKGAITWDGIWQINDLKSTKLDWAVQPIPQIGDTNAVWANSHNFSMVKQAKPDQNRADASRVFIGWISSKSKEWAGAAMIPARNSERTAAETAANAQTAISKQVDAMRFLPAIPAVGEVQAQTLEVAVQEAVLQRKEPKAALDDNATKASKLMKENKKKFGG